MLYLSKIGLKWPKVQGIKSMYLFGNLVYVPFLSL